MEPETVLIARKDGGDGQKDGSKDGIRDRKRNMRHQETVWQQTAIAEVLERVKQ